MATLSARIPRVTRQVSRTMQKQQRQIVARMPMRGLRSRSRARTTRRVVVLTVASLAAAGVAAGTAYVIARQFAAQPVEERPGQAAATAKPAQEGRPEVALDGTSQAAGAEVAI